MGLDRHSFKWIKRCLSIYSMFCTELVWAENSGYFWLFSPEIYREILTNVSLLSTIKSSKDNEAKKNLLQYLCLYQQILRENKHTCRGGRELVDHICDSKQTDYGKERISTFCYFFTGINQHVRRLTCGFIRGSSSDLSHHESWDLCGELQQVGELLRHAAGWSIPKHLKWTD